MRILLLVISLVLVIGSNSLAKTKFAPKEKAMENKLEFSGHVDSVFVVKDTLDTSVERAVVFKISGRDITFKIIKGDPLSVDLDYIMETFKLPEPFSFSAELDEEKQCYKVTNIK
jgi:hypothetical protein